MSLAEDPECAVRRLIQYHPSVAGRDAIGNEIVALHNEVRRAGIDSQIFAARSGSLDGIEIRSLDRLATEDTDTLLIHYSLGHESFHRVVGGVGRRLMLYHDVTPPHLLAGSPVELIEAARQGVEMAGPIARQCHAVAAHSHSSAAALRRYGGPDAVVLPYLLRSEIYGSKTRCGALQPVGGNGPVLLATGRVLPHKRVEDVILVYDYLRHISSAHWRLVVAGSTDHAPGYVDHLEGLCRKLSLPQVEFTGNIPQHRMNALYRSARAFLSMSVHEGFCVPLVEAIRRRIPVFALAAAAVPETLRGAGVSFDSPDWPSIAEAIEAVDRNVELRDRILAGQDRVAAFYDPSTVSRAWRSWLAGNRLYQGRDFRLVQERKKGDESTN